MFWGEKKGLSFLKIKLLLKKKFFLIRFYEILKKQKKQISKIQLDIVNEIQDIPKREGECVDYEKKFHTSSQGEWWGGTVNY